MVRRKPYDIVPVKLRMREDLRRRIEELAKKDGRSVNEMTVRLLEAKLASVEAGIPVSGTCRSKPPEGTMTDAPERLVRFDRATYQRNYMREYMRKRRAKARDKLL